MKSVKLFISYAREDNELVEEIYKKLVHRGYHVWKDNHELLPGVNWERDLKKNLKECDYVILCLSQTSVSKTGYFQEEVKTIGKLQRQRPASQVFCIPIKLNEFDTTLMPPEFEELQYINMYDNWDESIDKVIKSIETNY